MANVKGYGLACTVAWTQLVNAMRADGMSVGDTCPPRIAAFIREVVDATYREAAPEAHSYALSVAGVADGDEEAAAKAFAERVGEDWDKMTETARNTARQMVGEEK